MTVAKCPCSQFWLLRFMMQTGQRKHGETLSETNLDLEDTVT